MPRALEAARTVREVRTTGEVRSRRARPGRGSAPSPGALCAIHAGERFEHAHPVGTKEHPDTVEDFLAGRAVEQNGSILVLRSHPGRQRDIAIDIHDSYVPERSIQAERAHVGNLDRAHFALHQDGNGLRYLDNDVDPGEAAARATEQVRRLFEADRQVGRCA